MPVRRSTRARVPEQGELFAALRPVSAPSGPENATSESPSAAARGGEPLTLPTWEGLPPPMPGLTFGTSSWTYPGWKGQIYSRAYKENGDALPMLKEYVRCPLFGCVGIDATFYRPPSRKTLQSYREVLPPGFEAVGKVYDRITIRQFGHDPRAGAEAGKLNPDFLSVQKCIDEVIGPWLEELQDRAGPMMFEFQTMHPPHRPTAQQWADELYEFFSRLPKEGRYAVELRNPDLFAPVYLEALKSVGVAHVFNSWTRMPPIGAQLRMRGVMTAPFIVSRALLRPGRSYEQAVDKFQPYTHIQEVQEEVRADVVRLIEEGLQNHRRIYVLVNNRLEGNSPQTIAAIRETLAKRQLQRLQSGS